LAIGAGEPESVDLVQMFEVDMLVVDVLVVEAVVAKFAVHPSRNSCFVLKVELSSFYIYK
jgi:hypothetical protein